MLAIATNIGTIDKTANVAYKNMFEPTYKIFKNVAIKF